MPSARFLSFEVAGYPCALPAAEVTEVVHLPELFRPPELPPALAGLLELRGRLLPVVRLDRLLGLSVEIADRLDPLYAPLLVLGRSEPGVALLASALGDLVTVPEGAIRPVAGDATWNGCVESEAEVDGTPHALLSAARLLAAEERRRLRELQEAMERRRRLLGAGA